MATDRILKDALRSAKQIARRGYEEGGSAEREEKLPSPYRIGSRASSGLEEIPGLPSSERGGPGDVSRLNIYRVDPAGLMTGGPHMESDKEVPFINIPFSREKISHIIGLNRGAAQSSDTGSISDWAGEIGSAGKSAANSLLQAIPAGFSFEIHDVPETEEQKAMKERWKDRFFRPEVGPVPESVEPSTQSSGDVQEPPNQEATKNDLTQDINVPPALSHFKRGGIVDLYRRGYAMGGAPAQPQRDVDKYGMYDKIPEALQTMQGKLTGDQAMKHMVNAGVRPGEMQWSGMAKHLASIGNNPTTRSDVERHYNPLTTRAIILSNDYTPPHKRNKKTEWSPENIHTHPNYDKVKWDMLMDHYDNIQSRPYRAAPSNEPRRYTVVKARDEGGYDPYYNHGVDYPTYDAAHDAAWPLNEAYQKEIKRKFEESLTPERVHSYMQKNGHFQTQEVADGEPRFAYQYKSPGGTNYREVLVQPEDGGDHEFFRKPFVYEHHWPNEENIIASLRMQDMQTPEGHKATLADETQSDWGQKYRKERLQNPNAPTQEEYDRVNDEASAAVKERNRALDRLQSAKNAFKATDYFSPEDFAAYNASKANVQKAIKKWWEENGDAAKQPGFDLAEAQRNHPEVGPIIRAHDEIEAKKNAASDRYSKEYHEVVDPLSKDHEEAQRKYDEIVARRNAMGMPISTPIAPYIDNTSKWTELAIKHALYQAAHDDSDYFAWPKGEDVADRYHMRNFLKSLTYQKNHNESDPEKPNWSLTGEKTNGQSFRQNVSDDKLDETVGEEMADKMRKGEIGEGPGTLPHDPSAPTFFDYHKAKADYANLAYKYRNTDATVPERKKMAADLDEKKNALDELEERVYDYHYPHGQFVRETNPDYENITLDDWSKENDKMHKFGINSDEWKDAAHRRDAIDEILNFKKRTEAKKGERTISGDGFTIGGTGHIKYYNEMYPKIAQETLRKSGYGKHDVGTIRLLTNSQRERGNPFHGAAGEKPNDTREYHAIRLTPELRERIKKEGFPRFKFGGFVNGYAFGGSVQKPVGNGIVDRAMKLVRDEDDFRDAKRIAGARNDKRSPYATGGAPQGYSGSLEGGTQELPLGGGISGGSGIRQTPGEGYTPSPGLEGLPTQVKIPKTGGTITAGPDHRIRAVAHAYMRKAGLPYNPPKIYAKVSPERARRIAAAYSEMKHDPGNPLVKAAYAKMAEEAMAQYQAAKDAGAKFEFWDPNTEKDPYDASPRLAIEDLRNNHHMFVYPTDAGFGSDEDAKAQLDENPLLADSGERWNGKKVTINDIFRAIHDYYGHAKEGVGFRADGEENAWRSHAAMFSPLARLAMTSETRGQNSWLNYGPHGEKNKKARVEDTVFADQKTGILPPWVMYEGADDFMSPEDIKSSNEAYNQAHSRRK